MLLDLLKRLAGAHRRTASKAETLATKLEEAHRVALSGDRRLAIQAYEKYLEQDPSNLEALNGLGACLAEIGNHAEATRIFELAYSLDDSFVPVMVNYGKLLAENNRAEEGLRILRRARFAQPDFTHTDAVYAGLCLRLGQAAKAREFQLKAWLGNFDNLRLANCYVFWSTYDDIDEALVASEHRFWAETVRVPDVSDVHAAEEPTEAAQPGAPLQPLAPPGERRLRIGYWSPDFRNHSVRYFSRPLLDAHDRDRFEVFLYHDFPLQDGHTHAQRERADHFHEVFNLTDAELYRLIRSHRLDVLVELAGHSSHNRLSLLAHRMARVQISALGYPPTTGLRSMDGKIVDRFLCTDEDERHYAERPVPLASSFWCFHPKEPIPLDAQPPVLAKGYITFGCVGNIAKISERMARAWARILEAVPDSRLLVRSISFQEPMAEDGFRKQLLQWGLPAERLDLRQPEGGIDLFASYNEIDIILDTFPFNGGTTTCFATYMGVPVVSLAGRSVTARMGASVLGNVGASDLVVGNFDDYVRRAIELAADTEYLRRYKASIRDRLQDTGLGNEVQFAREFERACEELVARQAGDARWESRIEPLPAKEMMRRAYEVVRRGNPDAARRIADHCLRIYPEHGSAHLLRAQLMAWEGHQQEAIDWLSARWSAFSPADRAGAILCVARMHLLAGDRAAASAVLRQLQAGAMDVFDSEQARLYELACSDAAAPLPRQPGAARSVLVAIPCDDAAWFMGMKEQLQRVLRVPQGWTVRYERCAEADRIRHYDRWLEAADCDMLVLLQKSVLVASPEFLVEVDAALERCDVVGFAGATRWVRTEWKNDRFEHKAGAFCGGSNENAAMVELQLLGHGTAAVVPDMAVLDGRLLAVRPGACRRAPWDEELLGAQALLEEAWCFRMGQEGARLAVHRGLGVFIHGGVTLDDSNGTDARLHWATVLGFDPFEEPEGDFIALSVPAEDANEAVRICTRYLESDA